MTFRDVLGWDVHETAIKVLKLFNEKLSDDFLWIDEALAETKKTFNSEDIRLIPKTPSAKRSRRQLRSSAAGVRRTLRSTAANRESLDSGVDLLELPKKTTRASTRKTSRAVGRKQQQDESRIDASLREEETSDMESEQTSQSAVQDTDTDRSLRKKNVVIVSSDDASCTTEDTTEAKSSRTSKRREAEAKERELEAKRKAEEEEWELKRKAEEKEVELRELQAKQKAEEEEKELKRKAEEKERKEREKAAEEEKRKAEVKEMERKRELKRKAEEEKVIEEKRRAEEKEKTKLDEEKEKEAEKLAAEDKENVEKQQREEATALNRTESAKALVKECSVMLARDDSLTPIAVYSASKNQACVVSPPLMAANTSQLAATGGSGTSSAGRLFNFVKNAVGALLPSVMHKTASPSSGKNTPANRTVTAMLMFDESPAIAASPPSVANGVTGANIVSATNAAASDMRRVSSANCRSSVAKHRTSVGGPRLSMSKKRSLSRGNKARLSAAHRVSAPRTSLTAQTIKESVVVSSGSEAEITDDSDAEIQDTPPQRVTRSKVRQPPAQQQASKPAAAARALPDAPPVRVTRSKMRVKPPQPKLDDSDDDLATPTPATSGFHAPGSGTTPSTVVRNKGSRVQQMQQMLCQNPSFGLRDPATVGGKTGAATAAAKVPVKRTSSKRANETADHNDSGSPPKRQCTAPEFMSPQENNRYHFPVNSQALRGNDTVHPVSFLNQLKKKQPTTPMHNSSSVGMLTSFIQRNTPKVLTREEILEKKRRELEAKNKKTDETIAKRMEMNQQKLVEKQRQREERIQQVMRRKQEMEQQRDATASFFSKKTTAGGSGSRLNEQTAGARMTTRQHLADEPSKTDLLEKQKLRDKRMAEADQRRKQDEEAKRQLVQQQEREKQAQEEQARRRREQEENERRQRLEDQRRAEEERRARIEKERQLELERVRQAEEQRRKEEMERQKAREEQEKRERIEKERQEMERQREKERQRAIEIDRQKELERQKVAEEKARLEEEKRMREEQVKTQKMIDKHNQSVQKVTCGLTSYSSTPALQTTSAMPSKTLQISLTNINMAPGATSTVAAGSKLPATSSATVSKPAVPSLNKTFAKEPNSDSYQMTPVAQKVRKPASSENYDIGDLHSDDSTDEEDKPRKKIPAWAAGPPLKAALINQQYHPPNLNQLFGKIDPPNLNEVFEKKKPRFNKRTSSAHWDTSIMLPTTP